MDTTKLKNDILEAVNDYLDKTEAWDEAMVAIDRENGEVELLELEESESPEWKGIERCDVWPVLDFIEMKPDGTWIPDNDSISEAVKEYE